MPYINVDGKLQFVTQEQYDTYTLGQNTTGQITAAGGNVVTVWDDAGSQQILYPNTTNTSPDQTLVQAYQPGTTNGAVTDSTLRTLPVYAGPTSGVTYAPTDDPASQAVFAQLRAEAAATQVQTTPQFVTDPNYEGGGYYTSVPVTSTNDSAGNVSSTVDPQATLSSGETTISDSGIYRGQSSFTPAELDAIAAAQGVDAGDISVGPFSSISTESDLYANEGALTESAARDRARQQQTISQQRRQINNGDWRVRLRLAPASKYLYNAPNPGILQPLAVTDGIIFPYTPSISTAYKANYTDYNLTHSNYKGYFYQNSNVDPINISCIFTAQGSAEADYLLAVIHFLRSATKMFYGQDAERGSPPPLVYLTGLGQYQFNEHPCVISSFEYKLPADVDYIRARSTPQNGMNLTNQRDRQTVSTNSLFGSLNRLAAALLPSGAIPNPLAPPTLGLNDPTYVPTKMDISLTLLPIQSRKQISTQFSVKEFANGNLLKGGFW